MQWTKNGSVCTSELPLTYHIVQELLQQTKLVNMDNLKAEQELYDLKKTHNKLMKYRKHYEMSEKIMNEIVDLACKTSEFKTLTDGFEPTFILIFILGYTRRFQDSNVSDFYSGFLSPPRHFFHSFFFIRRFRECF